MNANHCCCSLNLVNSAFQYSLRLSRGRGRHLSNFLHFKKNFLKKRIIVIASQEQKCLSIRLASSQQQHQYTLMYGLCHKGCWVCQWRQPKYYSGMVCVCVCVCVCLCVDSWNGTITNNGVGWMNQGLRAC